MIYQRLSIFTTIFALLCSCEGKIGPAGKNSLVLITQEAAGANCVNGGQRIESGIDLDANELLSSDEIELTRYVCNGSNSLLNVVAEQAGATCSTGGLKIETGVDANGNKTLETSEIIQTKYVCNGDDGTSALAMYTDELAGTNCSAGGFKLQSGQDLNRNLTLEATEVQTTKFICLPAGDKQIRLEVGESNVGTNSTDWYSSPYHTYRLIKFNKANYANVDSITFVPSIYTSDASSKGYVELYNWTDNVSIANSEITSNTTDWVFKESRNLFNNFPNKEIILGIRMKSENTNTYVSTGIRSYIFIYKH